MTFSLYGYRFWFEPLDRIHFSPGKAGNTFRGALGTIFRRVACLPSCAGPASCDRRRECAYARLFEPRLEGGPSGLLDAPRPFVIRAAALDGLTIERGGRFAIDVHLFDLREPALAYFILSFSELVREGLGAGRTPAALRCVEVLDSAGTPCQTVFEDGNALGQAAPRAIVLSLKPAETSVRGVVVRFVTATELKAGGRLLPEPVFEALFGRIRDRISTLRALYGAGPLAIDFRGMGERAAAVRLTRCEIHWEEVQRRSSRTGQVHPLGGFAGEAEYEGELSEFLPYLKAAYWTGVGRQTVWGKGVIEVRPR